MSLSSAAVAHTPALPLPGLLPQPVLAHRSAEQSTWLVEMAKQTHGTGTTRVFVVTESDQPTVVATYAWCMASLGITELPERLRRGAGRYPQPVALLARLGVDERHEGQGLGAALLLDVISRVASLSDAIGCRGLLVHAESEQARGFYEHLIPEFELTHRSLATHPMRPGQG